MVSFLYAVSAFTCAIVAMIICFRSRTILDRNDKNNKPFFILENWIVVFCLVDAAWGLLASEIVMNDTLLFILSTAFHLCSSISTFIWAYYFLSYVKVAESRSDIYKGLVLLTILFEVALIVGNIWTHDIFFVSDLGEYQTGSLRKYLFYLQFLTYIVMGILNIIVMIISSAEESKKYRPILAFVAFPILFGIFQLLYADAPANSLGFMLGLVVVYTYVVDDERNKMLHEKIAASDLKLEHDFEIIDGLTTEYTTLYYVNLITDQYEVYRFTEDAAPIKPFIDANQYSFSKMMTAFANAIVHEDDKGKFIAYASPENIRALLRNKKSDRLLFRRLVGDELKWLEIVAVKFQDEDEEPRTAVIGAMIVDEQVKEEQEQKQALEVAKSKAEDANLAKSSFLFNMSHDIRTPMNAITGYTAMAKKHMDDKEKVEDCLDKIDVSSQHLLKLINSILDMSRIESGNVAIEPKASDVITRSNFVFDMCRELAASKNIAFNLDTTLVKNPKVYIDELHVNQVLVNIISNAIKYTRDGGKVDFVVREQKSKKPGYGDFVFVVDDNGIGMDKEFVNVIFDSFSREASSTVSGIEGTGLGMSIVKKLVDLMDGTIEIHSELEKGTRVIVTLPFRFQETSLSDRMEELDKSKDVDFKGKRILLVEDNKMNREIATEILEEQGLIIETAEDGDIAVEKVKNSKPGYYDAVLMDIQMPRMDGYEATRQIRALDSKALSSIVIVAMTANAFEEDRQNALNAGMNEHVAKPIEVDKLFGTLSRFL